MSHHPNICVVMGSVHAVRTRRRGRGENQRFDEAFSSLSEVTRNRLARGGSLSNLSRLVQIAGAEKLHGPLLCNQPTPRP